MIAHTTPLLINKASFVGYNISLLLPCCCGVDVSESVTNERRCYGTADEA